MNLIDRIKESLNRNKCKASFSEIPEKEAFKIPDIPFDEILKELEKENKIDVIPSLFGVLLLKNNELKKDL